MKDQVKVSSDIERLYLVSQCHSDFQGLNLVKLLRGNNVQMCHNISALVTLKGQVKGQSCFIPIYI